MLRSLLDDDEKIVVDLTDNMPLNEDTYKLFLSQFHLILHTQYTIHASNRNSYRYDLYSTELGEHYNAYIFIRYREKEGTDFSIAQASKRTTYDTPYSTEDYREIATYRDFKYEISRYIQYVDWMNHVQYV